MSHIYGYGDNCYGRGDYYRGDYYRGDPGLFGSIGGFLKKAAGVAVGFATGGPGGALKTLLPARTQWPAPGTGIQVGGPGGGFALGHFPPPPGMQERAFSAGSYNYASCGPNGQPRGRWNKSTYVTRGGGTSRWPQQLIVHPKGSECVRPRRMNVCNPRALRRAIRRASGFAKIARRLVRIQSTYKKGGGKRKKK